MKSNLLKWYMLVFLFASDFVMFADPGDCSEDPECDLEGTGDDPPAPLNAKLIWLAIVGVSFVLYYYNKKQQAKQVQ
jgi:hypothetical protein